MFVSPIPVSRYAEAAAMGYAFYLLSGTSRVRLNLISMQAWLRVPIRLDQIIIVFGSNGIAVGYVTWAYVTSETAARLGDGSGRPPLPEDWNDGSLLWIVDVVAPFGQLATVVRAARDHFGTRYPKFGYASRRSATSRFRSVLMAPGAAVEA